MINLFKPGMYLLNKVNFTFKFLLIILIMLLPLSITTFSIINDLTKQQQTINKKLIAINIIQNLNELNLHLLQHRTTKFISLTKPNEYSNDLKEIETNINGHINEAKKLINNQTYFPKLKTQENNLITSVKTVSTSTDTNYKNIYAEYSKTIQLLNDEITKLSIDSGLLFESNPSIYLPLNQLLQTMPSILDRFGEVSSISTVILDIRIIEEQSKDYYNYIVTDFENKTDIAKKNLQQLNELNLVQNNLLNQLNSTVDDMTKLAALTRAEVYNKNGKWTLGYKDYYNSVKVISENYEKTIHKEYANIESILINQLDKSSNWNTFIISFLAFTILLTFYIFISLYLTIRLSTKRIEEGAKNAANGNLTYRLSLKTNDEFQIIEQSLNSLIHTFQTIIHSNKKIAYDVTEFANDLSHSISNNEVGSAQIAKSIASISKNTTNQLNNVEKNNQLINSLSSGIEKIYTQSNETRTVSEETILAATAGSKDVRLSKTQIRTLYQSVQNLQDVMNNLGKRSEEIGGIVEVISSIAKQTNLLALNAAIEAARSGEAGKGFTIVAQEVRKLALEATQSAQQIKSLISITQRETLNALEVTNTNAKEVQISLELIEKTEQQFLTIQSFIDNVTNKIHSVSNEATSLNEVSQYLIASNEEIKKESTDIVSEVHALSTTSKQQHQSLKTINHSSNTLTSKTDQLNKEIKKYII